MSIIRRKVYDITEFKALPDAGGKTGRFEALVSIFGNIDLQGDKVLSGAFSKSLEKWRASGDPIPIIWAHSWGDPNAHIGVADPALAEETEKGLKLVGTFDIDKPFAKQVYDLVKSRRVKEWSFAYDIIEEKPGKDRANELVVLEIIEAGPCLKGANTETETLGVKSALEAAAKAEKNPVASVVVEVSADTSKLEAQLEALGFTGTKAGRVLSKANETKLRGAHSAIGDVLAALPAAAETEEEKTLARAWLKAERQHKDAGIIVGSFEELRSEIRTAAEAWAEANVAGFPDNGWVYVMATFPDTSSAILEIIQDGEETRYVRASYARDDEGNITITAAEDVDVSTVVSVTSKAVTDWLEAETAHKAASGEGLTEDAKFRLDVLTKLDAITAG